MRIFSLAVKSIRCKWLSHLVVFVQLSVSFSILIYVICAVFNQFDIIITANGAYQGCLYLSPDIVYLQSLGDDYQGLPMAEIEKEYYEKVGVSSFEELTTEQQEELRGFLLWRFDEEYEKNHYKGKYFYSDLHEALSQSGFVEDTTYNYSFGQTYSINGSDQTRFAETFLVDSKLYDKLKLNVKGGVDLQDYKSDFENRYFYALMYPDVSYGGQVNKSNYSVGDLLVGNVYNIKERCYETFYFEIVGELSEPTYVMKGIGYSGASSNVVGFLEMAFLTPQSISENGALLVIRPEEFDILEYYSSCNENFTLVKPRPDLTDAEYSELLDLIRECGFNVIDLDEAERNTIDEILRFISENCLILAASLLMVIFSIISVSMLSGEQVRREYAVYRLCGADLRKVKALSAVKWAFVFIPSMVMGTAIAIIYSGISEASTHFIALSAVPSGVLFAVLYVASFMMSYRSAGAGYKSTELSE